MDNLIDVSLLKIMIENKPKEVLNIIRKYANDDIVFNEAVKDILKIIKKLLSSGSYAKNLDKLIDDVASLSYVVLCILIDKMRVDEISSQVFSEKEITKFKESSLYDDDVIILIDNKNEDEKQKKEEQ